MQRETLRGDSFNELAHQIKQYLDKYPVAGYGTFFQDNLVRTGYGSGNEEWTVTVTRNETAD